MSSFDRHTAALIQSITGAMSDKAAVRTMEPTGENVVKYTSQEKNILLVIQGIAIILGLICWFTTKVLWAALIFPVFFGLLVVPGLMSYVNQKIFFDEDGFTVRNFFGIRRRYTYQDVVAGIVMIVKLDGEELPGAIDLDLSDGRHLKLDTSLANRHVFYERILAHHPAGLPKANPRILGMTEKDMAECYVSGILHDAMLVPEDLTDVFRPWKHIHYLLCTFSGVLLGLSFFRILWLFVEVLVCLLDVTAAVLYFRHPEFYTAWEIPNDRVLQGPVRKRHKCGTFILVSMLGLLASLVLLLPQLDYLFLLHAGPGFTALAAAAFLLPMAGLIFLFRRSSWEFKTYHLGFGAFFFSALGFSGSLLCLVYSLGTIAQGYTNPFFL